MAAVQAYLTEARTAETRCIPLSDLARDEQAVVVAVPDSPLLASLGLRKGKRVRLCTRQLCGGPLVFEVDDRYIALAHRIAEGIYCAYEG